MKPLSMRHSRSSRARSSLDASAQDDADAPQQPGVTSDTFGRPNAWDAARNPELTEEFAIHVAARRTACGSRRESSILETARTSIRPRAPRHRVARRCGRAPYSY